jgi:signal transduction histidine kinase
MDGNVKEAAFDSKMMEHVFSNILHNALKYSSEDKPVEVVVKCDHESYEVSVRDRGIGIPVLEQDQLFTSFFRASNTGNIAGTGMGLVIVKQFVDLHKGKIQIKSKEKEGCVVSIKFPLKPTLDEQGIDY